VPDVRLSEHWVAFEAQVSLRRHRCWKCGRHWAAETFGDPYPDDAECAPCVRFTLRDVKAELATEQRRTRALRGAVTKGKRR
jgi:hypothetical protein